LSVIRSIFAIAAGFFATAVLSLGGDLTLRAAMPQAFDVHGQAGSPNVLLLILLYVGIFGAAGGYITAHFAPRRPVAHALILGTVSLVISAIVTISAWGAAPAWYHLAALLLIVPVAFAGGKLREVRLRKSAMSSANAQPSVRRQG
jgi:hypothetical protein